MLRAAQGALVITLVPLLLVAHGAHGADSSAEINQLQNAFKLLQLQLKQTTETAEHISSLLSNLGEQQSGSILHQDVSPVAAKPLLQQQQKQKQAQQQQGASDARADVPQGDAALSGHASCTEN